MIHESEQVAALRVGRSLPSHTESVDPSKKTGLGVLVLFFLSGLIFVAVASVAAGTALGWRPVVIQTGSMDPSIPVGSLVLARPIAAGEVSVGHVVVMMVPGRAPVTHRVSVVDREAGLITTKGDANSSPDPVPHRLQDSELVAAYVVPSGGRLFIAATHPVVPTGLAMIAVLVVLPALFPQLAADVRAAIRRPLPIHKKS